MTLNKKVVSIKTSDLAVTIFIFFYNMSHAMTKPEQAGLSLNWSQTPKTGFLVMRLICNTKLSVCVFPRWCHVIKQVQFCKWKHCRCQQFNLKDDYFRTKQENSDDPHPKLVTTNRIKTYLWSTYQAIDQTHKLISKIINDKSESSDKQTGTQKESVIRHPWKNQEMFHT